MELFHYQYQYNRVYQQWCTLLNINPATIRDIQHIPFLPISLFKTHKVITGNVQPQMSFTSSGTTQTINSHHYIHDINIYKKSFTKAFSLFYGDVQDWCIIGLLPAYLERTNSSLVYMVNDLIQQSKHERSGFYLYDFEKLHATLLQLEGRKQQTLLIGVTFALLDFAAAFPMQLQHTVVMETGGMKGRKKELTRNEVHAILKQQLGVNAIHSEYGMTELLSQAYAKAAGVFHCPPWMKVLVRDEEDPLKISVSGKGILNIIDLANIESCAFIATDDAGIVHEDGSFEVWGRVDNSDIRGCSLLVV
ncbi:acyl transferase [Ilyomonas limi]|uniref:Acyl transferase n=1 Tax=Ilyomonas limi TaxID=2575867 RepID=A0A4U3KUI3_9BACT|nr:acyl transferase [Ilyomonas limi]